MRCDSSYIETERVYHAPHRLRHFPFRPRRLKVSSYLSTRKKNRAYPPDTYSFRYRVHIILDDIRTVYCSTVGTTVLQVRTVHTYVLRASINIAIHIGFRRHADELWNYSCPSNLSSQQPIPTVQRSKHFLLLPQASETCKK